MPFVPYYQIAHWQTNWTEEFVSDKGNITQEYMLVFNYISIKKTSSLKFGNKEYSKDD